MSKKRYRITVELMEGMRERLAALLSEPGQSLSSIVRYAALLGLEAIEACKKLGRPMPQLGSGEIGQSIAEPHYDSEVREAYQTVGQKAPLPGTGEVKRVLLSSLTPAAHNQLSALIAGREAEIEANVDMSLFQIEQIRDSKRSPDDREIGLIAAAIGADPDEIYAILCEKAPTLTELK